MYSSFTVNSNIQFKNISAMLSKKRMFKVMELTYETGSSVCVEATRW